MKFLIDNAPSPEVAKQLNELGHDAIHVRDLKMQQAADSSIFDFAKKEGLIIVSADTDFGTLLALRNETKPSVILFRKGSTRDPKKQAPLIQVHLPQIKEPLEKGSVVVFTEKNLRLRTLPIGRIEKNKSPI